MLPSVRIFFKFPSLYLAHPSKCVECVRSGNERRVNTHSVRHILYIIEKDENALVFGSISFLFSLSFHFQLNSSFSIGRVGVHAWKIC